MIPWEPLTRFEGPPERLLERCRQEIDRRAHLDERANLLAVSQVLAGLRFKSPELLSILGGPQVMIESPVLRQLVAETRQADILRFLTRRFQSVPSDVAAALRKVTKEKKLDQLIDYAAECPTMEAFREKLLSS